MTFQPFVSLIILGTDGASLFSSVLNSPVNRRSPRWYSWANMEKTKYFEFFSCMPPTSSLDQVSGPASGRYSQNSTERYSEARLPPGGDHSRTAKIDGHIQLVLSDDQYVVVGYSVSLE